MCASFSTLAILDSCFFFSFVPSLAESTLILACSLLPALGSCLMGATQRLSLSLFHTIRCQSFSWLGGFRYGAEDTLHIYPHRNKSRPSFPQERPASTNKAHTFHQGQLRPCKISMMMLRMLLLLLLNATLKHDMLNKQLGVSMSARFSRVISNAFSFPSLLLSKINALTILNSADSTEHAAQHGRAPIAHSLAARTLQHRSPKSL
jgi:hypothetical protein